MSAHRYGNFSSSSIHKLMTNDKKGGFGKPALTYIQEKKMELRLGRALNTDASSRPAQWGSFVEQFCHDTQIGLNWTLCSEERLAHTEISNWTGAPDLIDYESDTVGDIKSPQLKNFCELSDICLAGDVFELRESFPEYFFQLVSNAILTNTKHAQLFVFCPYQYELDAIRELALESDDYKWIYYAKDKELPYLVEGGYYKNLNTLRFAVTDEMREELTNRVKLAVEMLCENKPKKHYAV